jgi:hypothetical protein
MKPFRLVLPASLVLGAMLGANEGFGKDPEWDTWQRPARATAQEDEAWTNSGKLFGGLGISLYHLVISPVLPSACPFRPTCSGYALEAIGRHGLLNGVLMGTDRLTRCHSFSFFGGYPESDGHLKDPPAVAPFPFLSAVGF